MKTYSRRSIIAHWLTLVLLAIAFYLGYSASQARVGGNATLATYQVHLLVGDLVLVLTLVRIFFRRKDGAPAPMGSTVMDKFAKLVHISLYGVLILLPVTGMVTVATSSIANALSAGNVKLLPANYSGVPIHELHLVLLGVLISLALLHVLGAIKHQFFDKDELMMRMSLK
jgi:cytochrome b561